jgi:hypothetical protein
VARAKPSLLSEIKAVGESYELLTAFSFGNFRVAK